VPDPYGVTCEHGDPYARADEHSDAGAPTNRDRGADGRSAGGA
jgi:hypothetical protein